MRTFDPSFIEIEIEDYEIEILRKAKKILHEITCEMGRKSCTTLETDEGLVYSIDTIKGIYDELNEFCSNPPNKMY